MTSSGWMSGDAGAAVQIESMVLGSRWRSGTRNSSRWAGFSPGVRGQPPEAVRLGTPHRVFRDARFRDRNPDPGRTEESQMEPQAWERWRIRARHGPTAMRQKDTLRAEGTLVDLWS